MEPGTDAGVEKLTASELRQIERDKAWEIESAKHDALELEWSPSEGFREICADIMEVQRHRRNGQKVRIQCVNGITSAICNGCFQYYSGMTQKEREKIWTKASKMLADSDKGKEVDFGMQTAVVIGSAGSRIAMQEYEDDCGDRMVELFKQLPIADWFLEPDQRGISYLIGATILGEAGNLYRFDCPAKLWARMFGVPFEKNGVVQMPSTWRRNKKQLTKDEWMDLGYNPRRNATMYQLRKNIVMQNKGGPYRARYDKIRGVKVDPKQVQEDNPDWDAAKCNAWAEERSHLTEKAMHPDWTPGHRANHAMLLAAKLFVKRMWMTWWGPDALSTEWRGNEETATA